MTWSADQVSKERIKRAPSANLPASSEPIKTRLEQLSISRNQSKSTEIPAVSSHICFFFPVFFLFFCFFFKPRLRPVRPIHPSSKLEANFQAVNDRVSFISMSNQVEFGALIEMEPGNRASLGIKSIGLSSQLIGYPWIGHGLAPSIPIIEC